MRHKPQNSKGYAESPEFLPALGLLIFNKNSVNLGKLDFNSLDYNFLVTHTHTHIIYIYI